MPPSAQRRTRTRKQPDALDKSDVDEGNESHTTPSRKRRRVNTSLNTDSPTSNAEKTARRQQQQQPPRSTDAKVLDEDESFNEEDHENVIRNLRTAKYRVMVRQDYANEVHEQRNPEGEQAYAKIAGKGWTFFVRELVVRIGRPPDERPTSAGAYPGENGTSPDDALVHIDLGPSKLVSRQHAEIRFAKEDGSWYLYVNGRNGAKLDEAIVNRGQSGLLRSGSVIEIAGTQMMFVAPNEPPQVHPDILAMLKLNVYDNEGDEDDLDTGHAPSLPHRTPTRGTDPKPGGNAGPASSTRNLSPAQNHGSKRFSDAPGPHASLMHNDGASRNAYPYSKLKGSPTYTKGLLMESTEDIDYSVDSAKDLKPPHSYAQMIGMAILSSAEEKLTLSKIYDWIKDHYAFYRFSGSGWQNSIRHNLSLNKQFEKVARRTDEPGKGMKWQIVPDQREEFIKKSLTSVKKPGISSGPTSPSKEGIASMQHNDFAIPRGVKSRNGDLKTSPGSTPPMSHYPLVKQAWTPDRASSNLLHKLQGGGDTGSSPQNGFLSGMSPFPLGSVKQDKWGGFTEAAAAGSPGGPRMSMNVDAAEHLTTPLITKHAPKLAPPSTARLPSQFMPMSSPAPFWKYADLIGNTPAAKLAGIDSSPVKGLKPDPGAKDGLDVSNADRARTDVRSSSPPVAEHEVGGASPTKGLSRSRSGTDAGGVVKSAPRLNPTPQALEPHRSRSPERLGGSGAHALAMPTSAAPHPPAEPSPQMPANMTEDDDDEDDDEEGGGGMIDLAKGFQPIGSFHRNMNATGVMSQQ